jgi:hypothetical protein
MEKSLSTAKYNEDTYYTQLAEAFVHGIQPGIASEYIIRDPRSVKVAAPYLKTLATMRYKLRDFLSYGSLQRDLKLTGDIPLIDTKWKDYMEKKITDKYVRVILPAVQHSVYKNEADNKVAFIFANASRSETVSFSFDVDASKYALSGDLNLREISPNSDTKVEKTSSKFIKSLTLKPLESIAFVVGK